MNSIQTLLPKDYPHLLKQILGLPKQLYIRGEMPSDEYTFLTIVGSRRYTEYGKEAVEVLIKSLAGLPVVVVSGLAFGIDAIAHKAALSAGLKTVAVPGSGLSPDVLYPASNHGLANMIVEAGGALVSPFENDTVGAPWTFPVRNRIMAGMSHATLVIEAEIKSGTLITSKHATEFNRNVFAVPGSIFSKQSAGPHMLIRLGATPITTGDELIEALGFKIEQKKITFEHKDLSADEIKLLTVLENPLSREELIFKMNSDASAVNSLISLLEIKGLIQETMGEFRKV